MSKSLINLDAYGIVQARGTMYPYPIIKKTNPTSSNIVQVGRMWINTATNAFFVYTSNGNWASLSNTTGVFTGGLTVTGSPTSITSAVLGLNDTGTGATTIGNPTGALAFVGSTIGLTGPATVTGALDATTTVTGGTGVTATTGNVEATAGSLIAGGTLGAGAANQVWISSDITAGSAGSGTPVFINIKVGTTTYYIPVYPTVTP